ncbi:CoA-binding protein [Candidatus Woesearchaeota archaeon]|nr:CoA-binding protein [Candidatus Woesearchaeota archaeon]
MGDSVAVLGASTDKTRFSNKAIRAFQKKGYVVFPINDKYKEVEGVRTVKLEELSGDVKLLSVYIRPEIFEKLISLIPKSVKKIILNPGAESVRIVNLLKEHRFLVLTNCSIKMLGYDPGDF